MEDRAAPSITPVGTEFRVNATIDGGQSPSQDVGGHAIAYDAAGNFAVTWEEHFTTTAGLDSNVYVQLFKSDGTPLGDETLVNAATAGLQFSPSIGMDAAGNFAVTWTSLNSHGIMSTLVRLFYANGSPAGDEKFVNLPTSSDISTSTIGMDASGRFAIAWEGTSSVTNTNTILVQQFNSAGSPIGKQIEVSSSAYAESPALAMNATGHFVVTWANNVDSSTVGIYAREYDTTGTSLSTPSLVSTTDGFHHLPSVGIDASGHFAVVWVKADSSPTRGLYVRRFDAQGVALGDPVGVSPNNLKLNNPAPSIGMSAAGNFVVTWAASDGTPGTSDDVYAQEYDAAGSPINSAFRVNTTRAGLQAFPSVAVGTDGALTVVWANVSNFQFDAYAQRFTFDHTPVADAGGPYSVSEGGSIVLDGSNSTVPGLPATTLTYDWDLDGDGYYDDATGVTPTFSATGLNGPTTRTVDLRVTDGFGVTSDDTATITVVNAAPVVTVTGDYADINQGGLFTGTWSFIDPGADSWTATVDYGDGTVATFAAASGTTHSLSHRYFNDGSKTVIVTVTDGSDTDSDTTSVLVYRGGKVTNTNDSGHGSLRQAIEDENGNPGADPITFAIPGSGVQTITLQSALPVITDTTNLDGSSQPGYSGTPLIALSGAALGANVSGLVIAAPDTTVHGFIVNCFGGTGIFVANTSNPWIYGNYVGLDPTGTVGLGNGTGIQLISVSGGTVGANGDGVNDLLERNVISGQKTYPAGGVEVNQSSGVTIRGNYLGTDVSGTEAIATGAEYPSGNGNSSILGVDSSNLTIVNNLVSGGSYFGILLYTNTHVVIQGNRVGTNATGTAALAGAGAAGIWLDFGNDDVLIGGPTEAAGNLISGNWNGILSIDTSRLTIQGNRVGTNVSGSNSIPNGSHGIALGGAGSKDVLVTGNLISGNAASGVNVAETSGPIRIEANIIGTDMNVSKAIPNGTGVVLRAASGVTVGGASTAARNIISGSSVSGVQLLNCDEMGNVIEGNFIGTNLTGTSAISNFVGVEVTNSRSITIADNLISGNRSSGVSLLLASNNTIRGNTIGTRLSGNAPLANSGDGVLISNGSSNNVVAGNLISGNLGSGVAVSNASGNVLTGNRIGTTANGLGTVPNAGAAGVSVAGGSANNRIGGTTPAERNVISGNAKVGVLLAGSGVSGSSILGNYIGTDINGTADLGNELQGIYVNAGAHDNTIGGTAPGAGNVISGSGSSNLASRTGVQFDTARNNTVEGNIIGLDATGKQPLGNFRFGVAITSGSQGNRIGGTTAAARNIISGNANGGITLQSANTTGNLVQGNYIGTDISGTAAIGNSVNGGVFISAAAAGNTIGGSTPGAGNLISGNNGIGVRITGAGTANNVIQGNRIGTDVTGTLDLGNTDNGILIDTAASSNAVVGNLVSGNGQPGQFVNGIVLQGTGTTKNTVAGNYIGTNITGAEAIPNSWDGVLVFQGAAGNTIGGSSEATRNVISGNGQNGIEASNAGTINNLVLGNYVGLNATGKSAVPNSFSGISIAFGATSNTIRGNVASGNGFNGIDVSSEGTESNVVVGNFAGTDATGMATIGNGFFGIAITTGAAKNRIGTDGDGVGDASERNVVAGNGAGIAVLSGAGTGNTIAGNIVGLAVDGDTPLGNAGFGVYVDAAGTTVGGIIGNTIAASPINELFVTVNGTGTVVANNRLGTDLTGTQDRTDTLDVIFSAAQGVVISGNVIVGAQFNGIRLDGPTASGVRIVDNFVGTDVTRTRVIGNGGAGVYISGGASNNMIGTPGHGNAIWNNGWVGVAVAEGTGNSIRGNSITGNGSLGIDLNQDWITSNDYGDVDSGPNLLQNVPGIASFSTGLTTHVTGSLYSSPNTTFVLDFYTNAAVDESGSGEGARYLGFAQITTNANGYAAFDLTFTVATAPDEVITATATDLMGNTSEFSSRLPVPVAGGPYTVAEGGSVKLNASASYDPDISWSVLDYNWDLDGDGIFGETGTGATRGNEVGQTPTFLATGLDGPTTFPVALRVTEVFSGLFATTGFMINITNVAPTVTVSGATTGTQGLAFSVSGSHTDPGTADTHTYSWTLTRNGSPVDLTGYTTTDATLTYTPTDPGTYVATLTVRDDDGGIGIATRTIFVVPGTNMTLLNGRLIIYGTSGADEIKVNPGGGAQQIKVKVNGDQQTFVGVTEIVIYALEGNDNIQIAGGVTLPAMVFGGVGNDVIQTGGGISVVIGGEGNDNIQGGNARDIIIGGTGVDQIQGQGGDDLLIAGYTLLDDNLVALSFLRSEWISSRTFSQRIANLSGLTVTSADSSTFASRVNSYVFLRTDGPNRNVFDDEAIDQLSGDSGNDWFLCNSIGGPFVDRTDAVSIENSLLLDL